ncbi:hypothetical protein KHA80_12965 [Anaerobacillus sp. HL2]|nr:hypothetical protein KHA80_12965 [Anaerobacillus sp. HL2]
MEFTLHLQTLAQEGFDPATTGGVSRFNVEDFRSIGTFKADLETYGYLSKSGVERLVSKEILHNLDQMVYTFVESLMLYIVQVGT